MNVYQTDIDGVFVGITTADQDPMDENNMLIPAGCIETAPPSTTDKQLARWNGSTWAVEDIPAQEQEPEPEDPAVVARGNRDALLLSSDWTQVADATVDQAAWAAYRSLLRFVPQQAGFPTSITWPATPEQIMPQSYYVDPDYWISGYAQGDIFDDSALITAQLSVTAGAVLLSSASSSITSALTVSALAVSVKNIAASIIATVNISVIIPVIKEASAEILSALSVSALLIRLQHTSASFAFSAIVTANARFLWEPEPIATDIWTEQGDASSTWTNDGKATTIWTDE